ncbi:unnamed protein product, partial [Ranitomeya imitator]
MLRLSPYCARNTPMKVYGSVKKYGLHTDKQCDLREIRSAVREKSRQFSAVYSKITLTAYSPIGFVPTHYHTRLCPHTLPHDAPSSHITTRCSVLTHYHKRLHPHTLPHEAPSTHITTRGSVLTHYHTRLCPPHITKRGSVPTHYHTQQFNHFSQ